MQTYTEKKRINPLPTGVGIALLAAILFGASAPLAKLLLGEISPVMLAALLYLGSGLGLSLIRLARNKSTFATSEANLPREQWLWLAGAIFFGGMLAPVLLMFGLQNTAASTASLLLNLEGVFTALLAWYVFRENFDQRILLGIIFIIGGGVLLSWHPGAGLRLSSGALFVVAACACWGIDNNLTQKVSSSDPFQVASIKGLMAGSVNLIIAITIGAHLPAFPALAGALALGFFSYGLSLTCFVLALRHIGTARTGAYFSIAPFVGVAFSLLVLHESVGTLLVIAGALMAIGVWLHLTEQHEHLHTHERIEHSHRHVHDEHHQHAHAAGIDPRKPHTHVHIHEPLTHSHPHFPDIHHRHRHNTGNNSH